MLKKQKTPPDVMYARVKPEMEITKLKTGVYKTLVVRIIGPPAKL